MRHRPDRLGHPTAIPNLEPLVSLSKRSVDDLMMYTYVTGVQQAMPSVSVERAIEKFMARFGHHCKECDAEALRSRFVRMQGEERAEQATRK
jgi:hypothetical protein